MDGLYVHEHTLLFPFSVYTVWLQMTSMQDVSGQMILDILTFVRWEEVTTCQSAPTQARVLNRF